MAKGPDLITDAIVRQRYANLVRQQMIEGREAYQKLFGSIEPRRRTRRERAAAMMLRAREALAYKLAPWLGD